MWPWKKKPLDVPVLKPGVCECSHNRCMHTGGNGKCGVMYPPNTESPSWTTCACQIYIRAKDDGGSDSTPQTPSPSELEELYRK